MKLCHKRIVKFVPLKHLKPGKPSCWDRLDCSWLYCPVFFGCSKAKLVEMRHSWNSSFTYGEENSSIPLVFMIFSEIIKISRLFKVLLSTYIYNSLSLDITFASLIGNRTVISLEHHSFQRNIKRLRCQLLSRSFHTLSTLRSSAEITFTVRIN